MFIAVIGINLGYIEGDSLKGYLFGITTLVYIMLNIMYEIVFSGEENN
jgi:hypothetical protein